MSKDYYCNGCNQWFNDDDMGIVYGNEEGLCQDCIDECNFG